MPKQQNERSNMLCQLQFVIDMRVCIAFEVIIIIGQPIHVHNKQNSVCAGVWQYVSHHVCLLGPFSCRLTWFTVLTVLVCSQRHKDGAACHRTWLLPPCSAPDGHPASPSHFNYSGHCLQTRRGEATHRFYCWGPHTLLNGQKPFPVEMVIWREEANRQVWKKYYTLTRLKTWV